MPADQTVALSLALTLAEDRLSLTGETDLPDGAYLGYEVHHLTFLPVGTVDLTRSGTLVVDEGRFGDTVDLTDWPAGTIQALVVFRPGAASPRAQPPAVRARFGARGERLTGANVRRRRGENQVEARAELVR